MYKDRDGTPMYRDRGGIIYLRIMQTGTHFEQVGEYAMWEFIGRM